MSPSKSTTTTSKKSKGFTAEERAAMKERAGELKRGKANGEQDVLEKIAELPEPDRAMFRLETVDGAPTHSSTISAAVPD